MNKVTFGCIIGNTRLYKGISKVTLCRGLCTITAFTRYEQDLRIPDKFLADALLERLGLCPYKYEFIASEVEFSYSMNRKKIEELICRNELSTAQSEIEEYKDMIKKTDNLHMQYLLFQEAIIEKKKSNYYKAVQFLQQSLECTECSKVMLLKNEMILLTDIEVQICYELAECMHFQKYEDDAFEIYRRLKIYMEIIDCDKKINFTYYPHVLFRLAQLEAEKYNLGQAYEYLDTAEKYIIQEYEIYNLQEILELKQKIELIMGRQSSSPEKDNFLLALKLITSNDDGLITKEGFKLWENTVKQQY